MNVDPTKPFHTAELRPLQKTDHSALELWNQSAEFDPMPPGLFEEKVWADPGIEDEGRIVATHRCAIVGMVVGATRQTGEGLRGYLKLLAVHPDYRRRSIGSRLVTMVEQRLISQGCQEIRIAESAPNYLTPGVDNRYAASAPFFLSCGYEPFATSVNMSVDLTDNTRSCGPTVSEVCRIARAELADRDPLFALLKRHWPSWEAEALVALEKAAPSVYLAWLGDKLVGFSAFECNNQGVGWFGPIGVSPQAQGCGVGKHLLDASLNEMRRLGFSTATIPWVGPTDFYAKTVNATIERRFVRFKKTLS